MFILKPAVCFQITEPKKEDKKEQRNTVLHAKRVIQRFATHVTWSGGKDQGLHVIVVQQGAVLPGTVHGGHWLPPSFALHHFCSPKLFLFFGFFCRRSLCTPIVQCKKKLVCTEWLDFFHSPCFPQWASSRFVFVQQEEKKVITVFFATFCVTPPPSPTTYICLLCFYESRGRPLRFSAHFSRNEGGGNRYQKGRRWW